MSETEYSIVYVIDEANGAPRLSYEDSHMASITSAENVLNGTHRASVGRSEYLWVVKAGTPAHKHLCEHAAGRISSFLLSSAKEWLSKVAADPELMSCPAEDFRPAVKGFGLGSTDNGKKVVVNNFTTQAPSLNATEVQDCVNRAFENLNSTAKTMGLGKLATGGFTKEPTKPHTTLITQVGVNNVSPINDTLYNALEASGVEGLGSDKFPEDGNITIQWSKVHGRTNLRKFTITVDYKESK